MDELDSVNSDCHRAGPSTTDLGKRIARGRVPGGGEAIADIRNMIH